MLIASINQNRGKEQGKRCPNQRKKKQKCEHEPVVVGNPTNAPPSIISKLGSKSIISNLGLT